MAVQVYAIDPDVWKAAGSADPQCRVAVLDVWANPKKREQFAVALDGADVEDEYLDFLTSPDVDSDISKILQDIFNQRERSSRVRVVSPHLSPELKAELARLQCTTPVEPALIAMVASPSEPRMTLLLVGEDLFRPRGLHRRGVSNRIRSFFHSQLDKSFTVAYARKEIGLGQKKELLHGFQSREFEGQVRLMLMQRIYRKFGVMPQFLPPRQKYVCRARPEIGEVEFDCYIFLDVDGSRYVWNAECELKVEGNEGQQTVASKVKQAADQLAAIEFFEKERTALPVQARGYLVTNATDMLPEAAQLAQARGIQHVSVKMPIDWTMNMHWTLPDKDFPICNV